MLILLAISAFLLGWLIFLGEISSRPSRIEDWRGAFLKSAVVWGALVVVLSEGLSLFGLLRGPGIIFAWLAIDSLLVLIAMRKDSFRFVRDVLQMPRRLPGPGKLALLGGLGALVAALLAVAWVAPPNNVDSLLYHMSRVMHWVQSGSLRHYATGYHHQLFMPPWAEMAILQLRELWGSDKPANLVQWFSMVGSLIGVSAIAARLKVGRMGQLLAVIFAATVPMGVLQATSTQNDYVIAFWAICAAYLVLLSFTRSLSRAEVLLLGLSFGLGVLTKVTFFVYGAPIGLGFLLVSLRRTGAWKAAKLGLALVTLAMALNLSTWIRNLNTYGGLYGSSDWSVGMLAAPQLVQSLAREQATASPTDDPVEALLRSVGRVLVWPLSRVGQAAALNLVTPSKIVNQMVWPIIDAIPAVFDDVVSQSLEEAAWSHEDSAGNPLHFLLIIVSGVALMMKRGDRRYLAMAATTFVLLPIIFQGGSSGFGIRLQLPFFVLSAPLFGLAVQQVRLDGRSVLIGFLLLVSALPYLLFNNTRPIIGAPPWPTRTRSVFVAPAQEIMFAANLEQQEAGEDLKQAVIRSGCREIGLRIDSSDLEYQFWWLLDAPQSGYRLETIYTYQILEDLLDRDFVPCAVICTICGGRVELNGLNLYSDFSGLGLFLREDPEASD